MSTIILPLLVYENLNQLYEHNVELYDNDHGQFVVFCLKIQSAAFEKLFHSRKKIKTILIIRII